MVKFTVILQYFGWHLNSRIDIEIFMENFMIYFHICGVSVVFVSLVGQEHAECEFDELENTNSHATQLMAQSIAAFKLHYFRWILREIWQWQRRWQQQRTKTEQEIVWWKKFVNEFRLFFFVASTTNVIIGCKIDSVNHANAKYIFATAQIKRNFSEREKINISHALNSFRWKGIIW